MLFVYFKLIFLNKPLILDRPVVPMVVNLAQLHLVKLKALLLLSKDLLQERKAALLKVRQPHLNCEN